MTRIPSRMRFSIRLMWTLVALPPLVLVIFQWRYGILLPYMDAWELVPYLQKAREGTLSPTDLLDQHNAHRIAIPRAIMLLLATLTGWSHKAELALIRILGVVIFCLWILVIRRSATVSSEPKIAASFVIASIGTFSIAAWQNWIWGWQMQIFLCLIFALASLATLANAWPNARKIPLALLFAFGGTFSFAAGLAIWPAGAALLVLTRTERANSGRRVIAWGVAAILALTLYLTGFHRPPDATPVEGLQTLLAITLYIFAFIGSGLLSAPPALACALGLLGCIAWLVIALHIKTEGRSRFALLIAVALFVLCAAAITAAGRATEGIPQAVASRYTTVSTPFWIALALALLHLPASAATVTRNRLAIVALLTLLALNSALGILAGGQRADYYNAARPALITGTPEEHLVRLYPDTELLMERRHTLEGLRLSVFRNYPPGSN